MVVEIFTSEDEPIRSGTCNNKALSINYWGKFKSNFLISCDKFTKKSSSRN